MPFDTNKDGDVDFGDVAAKAGEILTKKFDWDKDGGVEPQEVAAELGADYAVKEVAQEAGKRVTESLENTDEFVDFAGFIGGAVVRGIKYLLNLPIP